MYIFDFLWYIYYMKKFILGVIGGLLILAGIFGGAGRSFSGVKNEGVFGSGAGSAIAQSASMISGSASMIAQPASIVSANGSMFASVVDGEGVLGFRTWYAGLEMDESGMIESPNGSDELKQYIWTIVLNVMFDIFIAIEYISVGFIVYGGVQYILAAGNPNAAAKGLKTIVNAVIGTIIVVFASTIVNAVTRAFGCSNVDVMGATICSVESADALFRSGMNWVYGIVAVVAVGFVIYGGFCYLTSAGDPAKAKRGTSVLIYAVIGLAVAGLATLITNLVLNTSKSEAGYSTSYVQTVEWATPGAILSGDKSDLAGVVKVFGDTNAFNSSEICNYTDEETRRLAGCESTKDLGTSVSDLLKTVVGWLGIVAVAVIVIGGVMYMTSMGDTGKVTRAKNTILYGVIGLAICALAFAIVTFVVGIVNSAAATDDLQSSVVYIVKRVVAVLGVVAVAVIVFGGVMYMTSMGDTSKVKKGKDTILYGVIGLVICALAFAIVNFVIDGLNEGRTASSSSSSSSGASYIEDEDLDKVLDNVFGEDDDEDK